MQYTEIMVRYGELSTKGKNRRNFIDRLGFNVRSAMHDFPELVVKAHRDRMHIYLNGEDSDKVIERLKQDFGIQNFSPSVRVERDVEAVKEKAVEMINEKFFDGMTFKVNTRRSDHHFVYDTNELNEMIGGYVLQNVPGLKVKMKNPDITLRVEVRCDGIYLSHEKIQGAGGLPVGTAGRAMLMLSGGIDSPVAGYLAMKRGVDIEMVRLTEALAKKRGGLAIFNGEALGQVASQTLESMAAINDVTTMPVLRPVVSMDKNEIIKIAQKIDTFDLSIMPFEDCCTVFAPPAPKTKPKLDRARYYESRLDVDGLIQRALDGVKVTNIQIGDSFLNDSEQAFSELL